MEGGAALGSVFPEEVPRGLLIEVLVAQAGKLDRLLEAIPKVAELEVLADLPRLVLDVPEHRAVRGVEESRGGHRVAEVLGGEREGAVDEVPVHREELRIVPHREVLPIELGILELRHVRGRIVSNLVRLESLQEIRKPDAPAPPGAHLLSGDVHELRGGHVEREGERPIVAHEDRGPEQRMKDDVVLPDEVVMPRGGIVPPLVPSLRLAAAPPDLSARGEITHHRLEPHIDPLALPPWEGHLDAPVEVASDRTVLEALLEPRFREREHREAPIRLVGDPRLETILEGAEAKERVAGLPRHGGRPVDAAPRTDELERVEEASAVLALIAPCRGEVAMGAFAFDIPVREEVIPRRTER